VLPPELLEFLAKYIHSIAQLEGLLLLRESPDVTWLPPDLARRLYISERDAQEVLTLLCSQGAVARDADGYRYAPASDDLAQMTALLAEHYRRHLITITNLVHAQRRGIREFAAAFKLKKE
jgi:hypothetical protein